MSKISRVLALIALFAFLNISFLNPSYAQNSKDSKYPDFSYEFLGEDKYENFNRKMFAFNSKLNKFVICPINVVWSSICPKYVMERIHSAHKNIEYPRRLISSLIQRDFKTTKSETARFLTNSTIGLGGLYDPAQKIFKLEPRDEDMEQALSKCKIKQGPYLVLPVVASSTPRGLAGRALDASLDPSSYIATPVLGMVKAGLVVNRMTLIQPMNILMGTTYADPYDVMKKLYAIERYIKNNNLDRKENIIKTVQNADGITLAFYEEEKVLEDYEKTELFSIQNISDNQIAQTISDEINCSFEDFFKEQKQSAIIQPEIPVSENGELLSQNLEEESLEPDLILNDYNPQGPVSDSLRTVLFNIPEVDKSMWSELSLWNRSFFKRIKTSSVNIIPPREDYSFRYIMQKDKNSPVAIIYPSIGEGSMSHHSGIFAKIFYDLGYSVIIQGSHFHWAFVKSMPKSYKPGILPQDAYYLRMTTAKIIEKLQEKYNCKFKNKILLGTSFGAMAALFVANLEEEKNILGISKFIAICPPVELTYSMKQADKNNEGFLNDNIKEAASLTAAKVFDVLNSDGVSVDKFQSFSEDEAKLISGFIMRQKLSDLIFTLEETPTIRKTDIYETINNMSYQDYAEKYLVEEQGYSHDSLAYESSLHYISHYLSSGHNYKIYHALDDYFVTPEHLKKLREYSGDKMVLLNHGSHLGFLYRREFMEALLEDIKSAKLKNTDMLDDSV